MQPMDILIQLNPKADISKLPNLRFFMMCTFCKIIYNVRMTDSINLKNSHLFLTASPDIDEIIHPLKDAFGVTSIVYQRNFNDGSEIRLSNQPAWLKHFYEQGYYRVSGFEKHPDQYQSGLVVWSHLSHHQPILTAARSFDIDHGMTLIKKTDDGCEFYFIGTTHNRPYTTNLLLNHQDFLQRFTLYFKEQAVSLLKTAYMQRLTIANKYEHVISDEQGIPFKTTSANFAQALTLKKIHLANNTVLSGREMSCAKLLLQGMTARGIAERLFISPRTVETHLQHLKQKLNCRTKAELVNQLLRLNLQFVWGSGDGS
jgi:DNA-binding CsgD family transcriptional regulator